MLDEKAHLTKEERRQRQKRLERVRCRVRPNVASASPVVGPNILSGGLPIRQARSPSLRLVTH